MATASNFSDIYEDENDITVESKDKYKKANKQPELVSDDLRKKVKIKNIMT